MHPARTDSEDGRVTVCVDPDDVAPAAHAALLAYSV